MVTPNHAVAWQKYYPAINEAGDAHEIPEEMSDMLTQLFIYAQRHQNMLVLNGDTVQPTPYGLEAFIGSRCVKQIKERANGYPVYLNEGNHDTERQLRALFGDCPNFIISRKLVIDDWYGEKLVFRHGHCWSPTWFGLRYFAPSLIELMCDRFPQQWYALSKRFGWMPSHAENSERYHSEVLSVWGMALRFSQENKCKTYVAHTHMLGGTIAQFDKHYLPLDYIIADAGVLFEGNFLEITDRTRFLNLKTAQ